MVSAVWGRWSLPLLSVGASCHGLHAYTGGVIWLTGGALVDMPDLVDTPARSGLQVRPPMPPVFFFLIDVSHAAVASGMLATVASTIKSCLSCLPGDERTKVGIITFDNTLHFYNLNSELSQPQASEP